MAEQGHFEIEDHRAQQDTGAGIRQITLLLTRHHDPFSNYICWASRSRSMDCFAETRRTAGIGNQQ